MLSFIIGDGLAYTPFRVFVTPSAPFALLTMLVPLKRATILPNSSCCSNELTKEHCPALSYTIPY